MIDIPSRPDDWPHYQWFRLVRRRLPLAAEVRASQPARRAWVKVSALDDQHYGISYYEIESARYQEIAATWDYDEPGMLLEQRAFIAKSEQKVRQLVNRWLTDLSELRDPGISTIPI